MSLRRSIWLKKGMIFDQKSAMGFSPVRLECKINEFFRIALHLVLIATICFKVEKTQEKKVSFSKVSDTEVAKTIFPELMLKR